MLRVSRSTVLVTLLFLIHAAVAACFLFVGADMVSGDQEMYWNLARALSQGRYTFWLSLSHYAPDTVRTPGYPCFLLLCQTLSDTIIFAKFMQGVLYLASISLVLATLRLLDPAASSAAPLFLILLLPNLQVAYYIPQILSEIVMVFLIALAVFLHYRIADHTIKWASLGILWGLIYEVRPMFLLFPLYSLLIELFVNRRAGRPARQLITRYVAAFASFALVLVPYAVWNYSAHGVVSVTPLEGGGGVLHNAFWQFRLPGYKGYPGNHAHCYWYNSFSDEPIRFVGADERDRYVQEYNEEWDNIDAQCSGELLESDEQMLASCPSHPELLPTYNAHYTICRERQLKQRWLSHIAKDPLYFAVTRAYAAVRLFVTGIHYSQLETPGWRGYVRAHYPFAVTFCTFILGGIWITGALWRGIIDVHRYMHVIVMITYVWLVHVPLATQSRYTIPVHLLFIMLLSIAIVRTFSRSDKHAAVVSR